MSPAPTPFLPASPLPPPTGRPDLSVPAPTAVCELRWGDVWMCLGVLVAAQVLMVIVAGVAIAAAGVGEPDRSWPLLYGTSLAWQLASFAGIVVWLAARGRRDAVTWKLTGAAVGRGVLIGAVASFGVTAFLLLWDATLGLPAYDQELLTSAAGGWAAVALAATAVVGAPLLEETMFRGVLFPVLRRRLPLWPAALISGVGFAMLHLAPLPQTVAFTWLGVAFAVAYERTRNLAVPVIAHATFNAISVAFTVAAAA